MFICSFQAVSNFLIGNLYCGKGNLTGAWHHYARVLATEPSHSQALQYLTALACHNPVHAKDDATSNLFKRMLADAA